jgi:PDZ domain-containing protein
MFGRWTLGFALASGLALAASAVPTPYWIIAPGSAVDLSRTIAVEGYAPSSDRYYLTDVTVTRASALMLAARVLPGVRVVRQDAVIPEGENPRQHDRLLFDSMSQSQGIAAVVAERAAGFRVRDPAQSVVIREIVAASKAKGFLAVGDTLVSVAGRRVFDSGDVARIVGKLRAGTRVSVIVRRGERPLGLNVPTIATAAGTRFGIRVSRLMQKPDLPIPVRYTIGNIGGGSGGLMFALQIYGALQANHRGRGVAIAGTGVLSPDGTVRPIEGTLQKLIAAKRAGARVFLVPRENYADVANDREIRIVPVGSFREALAALKS